MAGKIVTNIGCKGGGKASIHTLPIPVRARLEVVYTAECDQGSFVRFHLHHTPGKARVVPLSVLAQVMARCPIDPAPEDSLDVDIIIDGGGGCGGSVSISRVSLAPAPARWTQSQCRWLWEALDAANSINCLSTEDAVQFINGLPF